MKKRKRVKPLGIPSFVNVYDECIEKAQQDPECAILVRCLQQTMLDFQILREKWPVVGNIILRYAMVIAIQDKPISIKGEDKRIHFITDMVEHYNRLAGEALEK